MFYLMSKTKNNINDALRILNHILILFNLWCIQLTTMIYIYYNQASISFIYDYEYRQWICVIFNINNLRYEKQISCEQFAIETSSIKLNSFVTDVNER